MATKKLTKAALKRAMPTTKKRTSKPIKVAAPKTTAAVKQQPAPNRGKPLPVSYEQIAKRAYEIWLNKGCPSDSERDNWFQAEKELLRT